VIFSHQILIFDWVIKTSDLVHAESTDELISFEFSNPSVQSLVSAKAQRIAESKRKMTSVFGRSLVSFWPIFGQFLADLWSVFGRSLVSFRPIFGQFLADLWSVFWPIFGQFLADLWSVFGRSLVSFWPIFGQFLADLWSVFG